MFVGFDINSDQSVRKAVEVVSRAIAADGMKEDDHAMVCFGDLAELIDYVALMLEE